MIDVAVADGDGILLDRLSAFAARTSDLRVSRVTVADLLSAATAWPDVVLVDVTAGAADPVDDVRQLRAAGHRVLAVTRSGAPDLSTDMFASGARVVRGQDRDLPELAAAIRAAACDQSTFARDGAVPGPGRRPRLSEREESVLRAYASGLTLDAAARKVGVRPSTAKTYLERVKAKYRQAGRPAYTKLELAQRVSEDCPHS